MKICTFDNSAECVQCDLRHKDKREEKNSQKRQCSQKKTQKRKKKIRKEKEKKRKIYKKKEYLCL